MRTLHGPRSYMEHLLQIQAHAHTKEAGKRMSRISANSFGQHPASLKSQPQESLLFLPAMFLPSRLDELMTEEITEEHIKL